MKIFRIHFEDHGQDFLTWDVDINTGKVVDAQPFQSSIWMGCTIVNLDQLIDGVVTTVFYESELYLPGHIKQIKYPVIEVEALEIMEVNGQ